MRTVKRPYLPPRVRELGKLADLDKDGIDEELRKAAREMADKAPGKAPPEKGGD
jgi:hypothetical protein